MFTKFFDRKSWRSSASGRKLPPCKLSFHYLRTTATEGDLASRLLPGSKTLDQQIRTRPSSFRLSLLPIGPFVQQRSSFARLQRASVCHAQEQPSLFPETSPNAPFGQRQSSPEPTRTTFEFLFPFRMFCRMRQAPPQFLEVRWPTYPVPSLTTGRLRLNWSLNSPSSKDCTAIGPKASPTTRMTPDCQRPGATSRQGHLAVVIR
jgi:hypothetical protein